MGIPMIAEKEPHAGTQRIIVGNTWIDYDPHADEDKFSREGQPPHITAVIKGPDRASAIVHRLAAGFHDGLDRLARQGGA